MSNLGLIHDTVMADEIKRREEEERKRREYDLMLERERMGGVLGDVVKSSTGGLLSVPPDDPTLYAPSRRYDVRAARAAQEQNLGLEEQPPVNEGVFDIERKADIPWLLSKGGRGLAEGVGFARDLIVKGTGAAIEAGKDLTDTEGERVIRKAMERREKDTDSYAFFTGQDDAFAEEEIVDDAAGLLSIVDTELEGLTKGTGKLSHKPFVDRGEIQEVVDTGLDPERIYADFSQDIAGKRNRYLAALGEMYKKVAILNVIASLTNSPSQATDFMKLASDKFKALEGFDDEERYQKIAQGVFFREDGSFDAPKSKEEAFNRAIQFGATHDEAIKLSGHKAEPNTTTSGSYKTWHNPTTGQSVVMAPGQAPRGADGQVLEGWFPGEPDSGTEFERMKADALDAIQSNNISQAIGDIASWLLARDSMMRFSPEEATRAAEAMVKNWGAFGNMTEDEIDAYLEGATNIERTS